MTWEVYGRGELPREPLSLEEVAQIQRDVHQISEPYNSMIIQLLSLSLPKVVWYPETGRLVVTHSPEVQSKQGAIEAMRASAVRQYLQGRGLLTHQEQQP